MDSMITWIFIINLLLLLVAVAQTISQRTLLPYPFLLILIGILLAQIEPLSSWTADVLTHHWFSQLVLFALLPTLIFEAAFKLEVRQLRLTLIPIVILVILSLVISALLMSSAVALLAYLDILPTPLTLAETLLLGVILSATDAHLIVALYNRLSASKYLTLLAQGESLLNNVAAIIAAQLLFSLVVVGEFPLYTLWEEWEAFIGQFLGGFLTGWIISFIVGYSLKRLKTDIFTEISLIIFLVYSSFLIAEEILQVSGIMATVAVGITISGWGHLILSSTVMAYLTQFWAHLAMLSRALIFLLAGLSFNIQIFTQTYDLIAMIILIVLISRAGVIYGLQPLMHLLPYQKPISWRCRTVMYWGSLRGAVALAIILSLDTFNQTDTFLAVVMGVVLFTILIQGLSLNSLIRRLGLNQPSPIEKRLRIEGTLAAQQRALHRIPEFQQGGLFSARIADQQRQRCEDTIHHLQTLNAQQLTQVYEQRLLFIRVFAIEKALYHDMFTKGHLSECAYRNLIYSIELQSEAIRHDGELPRFTLHFRGRYLLQRLLAQLMRYIPGGRRGLNYLKALQSARDYEEAWGRHQGNIHVLARLDEIAQSEAIRPQIIEKVRSYYRRWHEAARARIDNTTERFAEFVTTMQAQLAERLILHAEREAIAEQAQTGFLPPGIAQTMLEELDNKLREQSITPHAIAHLHLDPLHLLRKVPLLKNTSSEQCAQLVIFLKTKTWVARQVIVAQNEVHMALFLIVQGVVRVSRSEDGQDKDIATLMAGDYFGETTLLKATPYEATYRTITPCTLYELRYEDFNQVRSRYHLL